MVRLNLERPRLEPRQDDVSETSPAPEVVTLEAFKSLLRDVEEMRADLDWLGAEVKKLRGRVTGGVRKAAEEPQAGPTLDDINALIKAGRFRR